MTTFARNLQLLAFLSVLSTGLAAQPVLSSLSPTSVLVGAAGFNLTVNGSGFTVLSSVRWDGATVPTTFVSATRLVAAIPANLLVNVGTFEIRVRPTPFSSTLSNPIDFEVRNPVPTITSVTPAIVAFGAPLVSVTVTGSNFLSGSVLSVGGVAGTTVSVSPNTLTAVVLGTAFATSGIKPVVVNNPPPGGGPSAPSTITVLNPVPTLNSIAPATLLVGSPTTTIVLTGASFISTSQARVDGAPTATTFISAAQLSISLPASALTTPGTRLITVVNPAPGGGTSATRTLSVTIPVPVVTQITPDSTFVGNPTLDCTLIGTGFTGDCVAFVQGFGQVSTGTANPQGTLLQISIPAAAIGSPGPISVGVLNTQSNVSSNLISLNVFNSVPVATVAPNATFELAKESGISITGTGFHGGTRVQVDGVALQVDVNTAGTALTASTFPASFATPGVRSLVVQNPGAGGGSSGPFPVNFIYGTIQFFSLAPNTILGGSPSDLPITIQAEGLVPATVFLLNGVPLASAFVGPLTASVTIPKSQLFHRHVLQLVARNPAPGGGVSPILEIRVSGPSLQSVIPSSIAPLLPTSTPVGLQVSGSSFTSNSVVLANGRPLTTVFLNSSQLVASLPPSVPETQFRGSLTISVTDAGAVSSIGIPLIVDANPNDPIDNRGTLVLAPKPPAPGDAFSVALTTPVSLPSVFSLVVDLTQPAPTIINFSSGLTASLSTLLGSPLALVDGLGILGPPTSVKLSATSQSIHPALPSSHTFFHFDGLVAPIQPLGISFSIQAIFLDAQSPLGLNATHPLGRFSL